MGAPFTRLIVALAVLYLAGVSSAQLSTFDADNEGWQAVSITWPHLNPPSVSYNYDTDHHATGGTPGGYISFTDQDSLASYFSAPAKFLGDKSSSYGATLSFDLSNDFCSNWNPHRNVILVGGGTTLYRNNLPLPTTDWSHYEVSISPGPNWIVGDEQGTILATAQDFQTVLGSLERLYIFGDWSTDWDTTALDNVALTPEPATLSLLVLGILAVMRRRKAP